MAEAEKDLAWLGGEIKTPPLSSDARQEAGFLLRQLQQGQKLSMPQSRPMPTVGPRCHELRITDGDATWRIVYRIDNEFIVILDVFSKKSRETPKYVIERCKKRLKLFDDVG